MTPAGKQSSFIWFLLPLIGLPFLGFGFFMGGKGFASIMEWRDMQSWQPADALLSKLNLEWHPGGKKKSGYHELKCTYTYRFGDQTYTTDRIGLYSETHSLDDWHKKKHDELIARRNSDQPVQCWVNPAKPSEAVLFRDLRPVVVFMFLLFCLLFGGAGVGLILGGVYGRRSAARKATLRAEYPDEPWMWKPHWASGVMPIGSKGAAIAMWCFAIFWNGISGPVGFFVVGKGIVQEGKFWLMIFLLFPLVGLALLYGAIYLTIQHLKFGRSEVRLSTIPGAIGSKIAGELVIRGRVDQIKTIDMELVSQRKVTTGSGKSSRTKTTELWKTSMQSDVSTAFAGREVIAPFSFDIPTDCQPCDDSNPRDCVEWKLKAKAEVPGVNFSVDLDVPVFKVDPNRSRRPQVRMT